MLRRENFDVEAELTFDIALTGDAHLDHDRPAAEPSTSKGEFGVLIEEHPKVLASRRLQLGDLELPDWRLPGDSDVWIEILEFELLTPIQGEGTDCEVVLVGRPTKRGDDITTHQVGDLETLAVHLEPTVTRSRAGQIAR